MSKEQTPITAEEWMEEMGLPTNRTVANIAEQYAQYRERKAVLEALERVQSDIGEWVPRHMRLKEKQFDEKEKQFTKGRIDCMMQISSHIETEVKPKYESSN